MVLEFHQVFICCSLFIGAGLDVCATSRVFAAVCPFNAAFCITPIWRPMFSTAVFTIFFKFLSSPSIPYS